MQSGLPIETTSKLPDLDSAASARDSKYTTDSQNLEVAMRSLYREGLVENAIPHDNFDRRNEKIIKDAYTLQAKQSTVRITKARKYSARRPSGRKHFESGIFVSRFKSYISVNSTNLFELITLHRLATQITTSALDPRPKWTFCSGTGYGPDSRTLSNIAVRPFRCRLCASGTSLCLRGQRSLDHRDA